MITIPAPPTLEAWLWLAIGFTFARAYGKRLDQDIQASEWFQNLPGLQSWLVKHSLDFLHHWWIGALIMVYSPWEQLMFFGAGILLDDLPDIPRRMKRYFPGQGC